MMANHLASLIEFIYQMVGSCPGCLIDSMDNYQPSRNWLYHWTSVEHACWNASIS